MRTAAIIPTAARAAPRFRFITGSSLAGRRRAVHALRPPALEGGDRNAGEGAVNLVNEVETGKLEGYVGRELQNPRRAKATGLVARA
jgi:hypothetical protein